MKILTLACWSHAIKFHLFSRDEQSLLASGIIERVSLGSSAIRLKVPGREQLSLETDNHDLSSAVAMIIATLTNPQLGVIADKGEIAAVGHRVAHGGSEFRHAVKIDNYLLDTFRELQYLAPLHSAPNIAGIEAAMTALPDIPHVAVFDTAFHLTMPESAYIYPLPYEWYENYGVRRYGFHGPSHLYLSRRAAVLLHKPVDACNLITIHLGRGVSVCAIRNGISIDTSMGMTPLEGAVMETRSGDIDPGIHAFMMNELNLSAKELEQILNQKSGVFGITGQHLERQDFLQAALAGNSRNRLALEIEAYRIRKYIGAYLAVVEPLDAIVFTIGRAETEWLVREMALTGLECFGLRLDRNSNRAVLPGHEEVEITGQESLIRAFVIPTNEELVIAEDVAAILSGNNSEHLHYDYSFASTDFIPSALME